jgi:hypothetical protein
MNDISLPIQEPSIWCKMLLTHLSLLFLATPLLAHYVPSPPSHNPHSPPPHPVNWPHNPPSLPPHPAKTCEVPSKYDSSNGIADDSPAIAAAFAECSSDATIVFTPGLNYSVLTPIVATNLSNVVIQVSGNLLLPQNITAIQTFVNATASGSLFWFTFAGSNIHYVGTSEVNTGWIDSFGQAWWDANPVNGSGTAARPHLISFKAETGSMHHFKSRKPIAWNVALGGSNVEVHAAVIDAYSTSGSFPFNTDGFDVTGTNITIGNSVIYNGDDAIAVGSGSDNILFHNNVIGYQTHGMSIGT